jgi:hypothetical protein
MPSATHIEAIRPPSDFPPASTGTPPAIARTPVNASFHAARSDGSGSGERLPELM